MVHKARVRIASESELALESGARNELHSRAALSASSALRVAESAG